MRGLSLAAAALAVAASSVAAQDAPPPGTGPRGTSSDASDDAVGYATIVEAPAGAGAGRSGVLHPTLAPGSFVELTALDGGRTIVALVDGPYRGPDVVGLSPGAASALGVRSGDAVRVRSIVPSPQDQRALRSGQAASVRLGAPETLLVALRHRLPPRALDPPAARNAPRRTHAVVPPPRAAETAPALRVSDAGGRYVVQVAALSSAARAGALAKALGGRVMPAGALHRVLLGPFADAAAAARARDGAARRGYADARILRPQ